MHTEHKQEIAKARPGDGCWVIAISTWQFLTLLLCRVPMEDGASIPFLSQEVWCHVCVQYLVNKYMCGLPIILNFNYIYNFPPQNIS